MVPVRPLLAALVAASAVGGIVVGAAGRSEPAPPAVPTCAETGPYAAPPPRSVGTPAGLRLCPVRGVVEVRTPGAVLDGLDLAGAVVVAAPDVVVRRSRIAGDGSQPAGVRTLPGGSVRIEDTTLTGDFTDAALEGATWTAERVELTGLSADGAHLGPGTTLRNSLLHGFDPAPGREVDAVTVTAADALVEGNQVQLGSGPGRGSAVLISGPGSAGAVHQSMELDDPADPAVVRGNELAGGRFTLLATGPGDLPLQITGNRFRRDPATVPMRLRGAADLRDNVFTDGGAVRR
ncbi:hypothetical protein GCM10009836_43220 [Pseudonocardia ailaonensis]|uniref:Right handed beta helix domain-containing protein n=1 Tax=Pseudonocardia ailaonensis TaxID=367279 RepID=A0ABN2N928_9PSEU